RGANRLAPEKPLGALREAARLGVLAIELDVKLSKDKVPVIRGLLLALLEPVERLQG
ncbi:MAG: glycerophosphodiester phosphodiesterase family protein, partial [Anaerolineales bacterium]